MKLAAFALFVSIITGCSAGTQNYKLPDFYDSYNKEYSFNSAQEVIQHEYNLTKKPFIIVILANTNQNREFTDQLSSISEVSPESHEYLYVVGLESEEDRSGYYITRASASTLLKKAPFKVIIYDRHGDPIVESGIHLNADSLKDYLDSD